MTDRTPLVSVIIPTYNRPDRLVQSLESVADQTYETLEIIVVDDASEMPAEEAVASLRDRIPYDLAVYRHGENRGANAARNTGLREASGEFVAFLDDDDEWSPSKVARQVEAFQGASADTGLVYTSIRIVDEDGMVIRTTDASVEGVMTKQLLCKNTIGSFSCVMVRFAAVDDAGLLDETFPSWQDLDWYIRISENWRIQAITDPLVTNHTGGYERITSDTAALIQKTYPRFIAKHRPRAAAYGRLFERKMLGWAAFRVGAWYVLPAGQNEIAQQYIKCAIALYPFEPRFYIYGAIALGGEPTNVCFHWVKNIYERMIQIYKD